MWSGVAGRTVGESLGGQGPWESIRWAEERLHTSSIVNLQFVSCPSLVSGVQDA